MRTEEFRNWLRGEGHQEKDIQNRIANCRRIERYHNDLDIHFGNDTGNTIKDLFIYRLKDQRAGLHPRHNITIDGDEFDVTQNFQHSIKLYMEFCASIADSSIEEIEKDIKSINNNNTLSVEEKRVLVKYRLGQSKYRTDLIKYWGGCSISGCANSNLLIASHIKPYSECQENEKYDLNNGLLLTPNYDKLFDLYLITFDDNGKIIISGLISNNDLEKLNIAKEDTISNKLNSEHIKYLVEHRRKFYEVN